MSSIRKFIDSEASSGVLLLLAAILAIVIDNSPLAPLYDRLLGTNFLIQVGEYGLDKPILLWVNDGLMAVFFLLIGLEIKREFLAGELSSKDQILLPAMAAFGGMVTAVLAGFGRAVAEVGAVLIVGGKIDGVTRMMTTAIALETSKGDLALALGLGIVLLTLALAANALAFLAKGLAARWAEGAADDFAPVPERRR